VTQRRPIQALVLPLSILAGCFLLLEGLARGGAMPVTIPAPSEVWARFAAAPNVVWYHAAPTLYSAASGYAAALAVSLGLAALATLFDRSRGTIYNAAVILHSIPLIALTPLLVIWLGAGFQTRAIIAAIACFFPMLVGAIQGFRATDPGARELFLVLAARPWQRFLWLAMPSALPFLFSGLKIAAPSAVLGTIIAEWAGADRGLGILMLHALFAFQPPQVWIGIIACCVLAVLAYASIALLERIAVRGHPGSSDERA
jgi:NitT/TauT family transport system permease protein